MPRTTQHAIYKNTPQLAEERFDPFTQAADECSALLMQSSAIFRCHEQHFSFLSHHFGQRRTLISQVAQHHSTVNRECQCSGRIRVIEVGWQKQPATNVTIHVTQQMQLETEEPARRRLAPSRAIFSQESYPSMPNRLADRDGLRVNQIKGRRLDLSRARGLSQLPDQCGQSVESGQTLFVGDKMRESPRPVGAHQQVSFLERGATERALQQSDRENLGIGKNRLRMGRTSPASPARMSFEIIINKAVDFGHLMLYAAQGRCPPAGVDKVSQLHSTHLLGGDDL